MRGAIGRSCLTDPFAVSTALRGYLEDAAEIVELKNQTTLVVSLFVPQEGAAVSEAGSLVYDVPIDVD